MKTPSTLSQIVLLTLVFLAFACSEPEIPVHQNPSSPTSQNVDKLNSNTRGIEQAAVVTEAMFDDFNYVSSSDPRLGANLWSVRSGKGGPGPRGCSWSTANVTFVSDPVNSSNKLMRLTSSTKGTARSTSQAEILTPMKYFEGTYAARVKFSDTPATGTDGGQVVQTFFTISPYNAGDPLYSELDFEYLSNGGWGVTGPTLWNTSWNSTTVRTSSSSNQSYNGWNDLVMVVSGGVVNYYVNGILKASHTGIYYPRRTMQIDFNQWFIDARGPAGTYVEDVDWVYHAKNTVLTTAEVNAIVSDYRTQSVTFTDNVQ